MSRRALFITLNLVFMIEIDDVIDRSTILVSSHTSVIIYIFILIFILIDRHRQNISF